MLLDKIIEDLNSYKIGEEVRNVNQILKNSFVPLM